LIPLRFNAIERDVNEGSTSRDGALAVHALVINSTLAPSAAAEDGVSPSRFKALVGVPGHF
jgi:hypothetical protein